MVSFRSLIKKDLLTFMTKTNLEIEEEFNKYFLDCIRSRFGVARFEGDSELLRDDISKYWLSKLKQRMDEIEGEVEKKGEEAHERFKGEGNREWQRLGYLKATKDVLNIIKSVDKNK